jgi:hypothetical protein
VKYRCGQIGKAWVGMAGMGCWRKMRYRRERVGQGRAYTRYLRGMG